MKRNNMRMIEPEETGVMSKNLKWNLRISLFTNC